MRSCCQRRSSFRPAPTCELAWPHEWDTRSDDIYGTRSISPQHFHFPAMMGGRERECPPRPTFILLVSSFSVVQVTPLSTRTSMYTNWKAWRQGVKSHAYTPAVFCMKAQQKLQVHLSEKLSSCWVRSEMGGLNSWLPEPVIFHGARNLRVIANRNLFHI